MFALCTNLIVLCKSPADTCTFYAYYNLHIDLSGKFKRRF